VNDELVIILVNPLKWPGSSFRIAQEAVTRREVIVLSGEQANAERTEREACAEVPHLVLLVVYLLFMVDQFKLTRDLSVSNCAGTSVGRINPTLNFLS
jgi:hypothetical protein